MKVLGIDTSHYRTSVCLVDDGYKIVAEQNPILPVKEGKLGLQQSQAVFEHLKQWPALLNKLGLSQEDKRQIRAVGVSTAPRPVEDSYMPVFKAGEVLAETIAYFLSVPLFKTTHQEGHIAAGEFSVGTRLPSPFIAVHFSGGTSEILHCERTERGYKIKRAGGTLDLHAGQFVDRVGVKLGLPFPSGPHLEKLASEWERTGANNRDFPVIPSYVKDGAFSFSGPATAALRLIEENRYEPGQIARAVEHTLFKTLEKALRHVITMFDCRHILIVGGVAANSYLRKKLKEKLEHRAVGAQLYFAPPKYSTDNAFGVACLTLQYLHSKR
ncbi:O-sialoglycoprotein endopeptidase [Caldalkalibacillus thermarum]|uniref:O-sialoglycoprotein endopeptidase n=1 Tax=Caldalkalibacillus thermarum TaxID=296745 RepID=UPI00166E8A39|nr:O-sialoglycoprotein endopeptidase [Caldalkalibacillus thermarum]GGK19068.1 O-sialoglycoprotein endopeptidase [Caldalkalibacillus thermarum]